MQSFYVWANYLWKTWAPLKLSPMYSTLIDFAPWSAPFLLSAVTVLGITALLLWRRRSWPGILGLWICYLLCLVPMLGLTEHPHFACDRYSFVVSIFYSVLLSAAVLKLLHRFSHPAIPGTVCAALLLTFSLLSYRQCEVWRGDRQLLPHIIATLGDHPACAKVEWLYGTTLVRQGEQRQAEQAFRNSIRADANYARAYVNLADVLMDQKKSGEAIATYRQAVNLAPDNAQAREGLAVALGTEQRFDEAAAEFREVLRRNTNNANAWQNLAITVHQLGQTNLSREYYARAQQIRRQ
jgi:tetratricopeptide (TPR) repeat protein